MTDTLVLRAATPEDLPLLQAWFSADHVRAWFGERTPADVAEEFTAYFEGRERVFSFIVVADGRPIGMVGWSRFGDFPDMSASYQVSDPNAANCDILIGELPMIGRGLGVLVIEKLLREHVFADGTITQCIIDPHVENARAIRTYEKAGFRFLRKVRDHEDDRELHLMVRARPNG